MSERTTMPTTSEERGLLNRQAQRDRLSILELRLLDDIKERDAVLREISDISLKWCCENQQNGYGCECAPDIARRAMIVGEGGDDRE